MASKKKGFALDDIMAGQSVMKTTQATQAVEIADTSTMVRTIRINRSVIAQADRYIAQDNIRRQNLSGVLKKSDGLTHENFADDGTRLTFNLLLNEALMEYLENHTAE